MASCAARLLVRINADEESVRPGGERPEGLVARVHLRQKVNGSAVDRALDEGGHVARARSLLRIDRQLRERAADLCSFPRHEKLARREHGAVSARALD